VVLCVTKIKSWIVRTEVGKIVGQFVKLGITNLNSSIMATQRDTEKAQRDTEKNRENNTLCGTP
jgi:hypothetical protein